MMELRHDHPDKASDGISTNAHRFEKKNKRKGSPEEMFGDLRGEQPSKGKKLPKGICKQKKTHIPDDRPSFS